LIIPEVLIKMRIEKNTSEEPVVVAITLMQQVAQLAQDNLRQGRRGSVSPLFELTLETVTELNNLMTTDEWNGEAEFSSWGGDALLPQQPEPGFEMEPR
jgi:hypothetical protein